MNYQLHIKQVLPVKNLKLAVIKVYDYYQTSKTFLGYMIRTLLLYLFCFCLLKFNTSFIQVTSLRQSTPPPVCEHSDLQPHTMRHREDLVPYFILSLY